MACSLPFQRLTWYYFFNIPPSFNSLLTHCRGGIEYSVPFNSAFFLRLRFAHYFGELSVEGDGEETAVSNEESAARILSRLTNDDLDGNDVKRIILTVLLKLERRGGKGSPRLGGHEFPSRCTTTTAAQ